MQVSIEDKSTVKKVIHVEIPSKDVVTELDKDYREINKNSTIKGFRKGKTPRKVLESKFSKSVHEEVSSRLIQNAFSDIAREHQFNVLGSPHVEPAELKPGEDYVFDITIEVKPELEDVDFKGIALTKNMYEVAEEDIEKQISAIRKSMATKKAITEERPVKPDDFVLIDYQGFIGGEPYEKTPKIENYVMAVSGDQVPGEFSDRLIGAIPEQELEIEVVHPEDDPNEGVAGKTITYTVSLKEIQEEELPPADDSLVDNLGQFENFEALKKQIRENLEMGIAQRVQHELSEQAFKALLEKYPFEIPEVLVESELEGILSEAEQAYLQNNMRLEDVGLDRDTLRTQYAHVAEDQARRHILLGKIIDQEKLELTDEEMEKSFQKMADDMNASVDAVKNFFKQDAKQLEYYKYTQLEKKAAELILENGIITEVKPELDAATETEIKEDVSSETSE